MLAATKLHPLRVRGAQRRKDFWTQLSNRQQSKVEWCNLKSSLDMGDIDTGLRVSRSKTNFHSKPCPEACLSMIFIVIWQILQTTVALRYSCRFSTETISGR